MTFKTFDGKNIYMCSLCERVSNRYTKEVRLINQKQFMYVYIHTTQLLGALSVFEKILK